jgi:hypothetical protein
MGAARLLDAGRDKVRSVHQARGRQARFDSLLPVYRDEPALTRFQLYWETAERVLAERPLTILDPQATSKTHLFMADPERFNLSPLAIPQSSPALPEGDSRATTRPEQQP